MIVLSFGITVIPIGYRCAEVPCGFFIGWVGYYIAVAGVVSFLAVMSMKETGR